MKATLSDQAQRVYDESLISYCSLLYRDTFPHLASFFENVSRLVTTVGTLEVQFHASKSHLLEIFRSHDRSRLSSGLEAVRTSLHPTSPHHSPDATPRDEALQLSPPLSGVVFHPLSRPLYILHVPLVVSLLLRPSSRMLSYGIRSFFSPPSQQLIFVVPVVVLGPFLQHLHSPPTLGFI